MFKIKKNSQRNIIQKDILTENAINIPSPQINSRMLRRPLTAKKHIKSTTSQKQSQQLNHQQANTKMTTNHINSQKCINSRLADRDALEEDIRRMLSMQFKERCIIYGDQRERLINRCLEKAALKIIVSSQNKREDLCQLIEKELSKIQQSKECQQRYEATIFKIQNMIQDRLLLLTCFR